MKRTIILALLITAISFAQSESGSGLTVEEVFSVETSEELEASLTDGYPMPWLAEILEDETIPEEDRYWLDCRVRAVIAQEFHRFYNENGSPIEVEADKIRYGESYWQEHFIIDPPGSIPVGERNPETNLWEESGFVYNRFGEKTGNLALIDPIMHLSRDGSKAVALSSSENETPLFGSDYLFFINADNGTYTMYPERFSMASCSMDPQGEYIVAQERTRRNTPDAIYVFDFDGSLMSTLHSTGNSPAGQSPLISPDGNYCLIASTNRTTIPWTRYCQLFSIPFGEELSVSTAKLSSKLTWSPNGEYFFTGQIYQSIHDRETVWEIGEFDSSEKVLLSQYCSNDGRLFASTFVKQHSHNTTFELSLNDLAIFCDEIGYTNIVRLSPDGLFGMTGPLEYGPIGFPFTVWQIGGEE